MHKELQTVKLGLALVLIGLFFGIGVGISFGVNEDMYKDYIAEGIAANPQVHDENSASKIWRYAQRAHFHATGIGAFCLGLIILLMFSNMRSRVKTLTATFIGLGSFYPLGWLTMFVLAPSLGRGAAHNHPVSELFTLVGVGGLLLGSLALVANLFFGAFADKS